MHFSEAIISPFFLVNGSCISDYTMVANKYKQSVLVVGLLFGLLYKFFYAVIKITHGVILSSRLEAIFLQFFFIRVVANKILVLFSNGIRWMIIRRLNDSEKWLFLFSKQFICF